MRSVSGCLQKTARYIIYRFTFIPEHKVEYISPAVFSITGYKQEEFYAFPDLALEIVNVDDMALLNSFDKFTAIGEKPLQLRVRCKDGRQIWIEGQFSPIFNKDGKLIACEGIIRDISERKQIEKELSRLNQLHILGETAATIAHEIRNPMTTVLWFFTAITKQKGPRAPQRMV